MHTIKCPTNINDFTVVTGCLINICSNKIITFVHVYQLSCEKEEARLVNVETPDENAFLRTVLSGLNGNLYTTHICVGISIIVVCLSLCLCGNVWRLLPNVLCDEFSSQSGRRKKDVIVEVTTLLHTNQLIK